MDPATFDTQTTKSLRALGINRVSLGLQSFNDTTLELIGRAHRMEDIYRAIESVVDGGVEVSIIRKCDMKYYPRLFYF